MVGGKCTEGGCLQLEQVAVGLGLLSAAVVEEGLELEFSLLRARRVCLLGEELELSVGPPGWGLGVRLRVWVRFGVRVRVRVGSRVEVSVRVKFPLANPESASASLMYCAVRSSRACSRRTTSVMRSPATFFRLLAANSFQKREMYLVVS